MRALGSDGVKKLNHGTNSKGKGKGMKGKGQGVPVARVSPEAGTLSDHMIPPKPKVKLKGSGQDQHPKATWVRPKRPPPPPPGRRRVPPPVPVPPPRTPPELRTAAPTTPPNPNGAGFELVHRAAEFLQRHYARTVQMAEELAVPAPPPPLLPTSADRNLMRVWWRRPTSPCSSEGE